MTVARIERSREMGLDPGVFGRFDLAALVQPHLTFFFVCLFERVGVPQPVWCPLYSVDNACYSMCGDCHLWLVKLICQAAAVMEPDSEVQSVLATSEAQAALF